MRIGSCLESNGFGDCCFCGRCGISGYFRVLLRKDPPEIEAEVEDNPGEGRSNAGEDIAVRKDEAGAITGTRTATEEGAGVKGTGRGRVRAWTGKSSSKQRLNGRVQLNIKQYQKTVSSIFWVQLALLACYTPFIIVSILRHST